MHYNRLVSSADTIKSWFNVKLSQLQLTFTEKVGTIGHNFDCSKTVGKVRTHEKHEQLANLYIDVFVSITSDQQKSIIKRKHHSTDQCKW